jgi:succinyl-CoA synthetase beta subunit
MVVRLVGTNEAEGQAILEEAGIATADTLGEGARRAVEAARAGSHGSVGR